jgi:hypothetical protein
VSVSYIGCEDTFSSSEESATVTVARSSEMKAYMNFSTGKICEII